MKSFACSIASAGMLFFLCMILLGEVPQRSEGAMAGNDSTELPDSQPEGEDTSEMDDDDATLDHRLVKLSESLDPSLGLSDDFNYLLVLQDVIAPPPDCNA
jgi:hypothetical protein